MYVPVGCSQAAKVRESSGENCGLQLVAIDGHRLYCVIGARFWIWIKANEKTASVRLRQLYVFMMFGGGTSSKTPRPSYFLIWLSARCLISESSLVSPPASPLFLVR